MVFKEGENKNEKPKTQITREEFDKMVWQIDPDLWDRAVKFEVKKKNIKELGQVGEGILRRKLAEQRRVELLKEYEVVDNLPQNEVEGLPVLNLEGLKKANEQQIADDREEAEALRNQLLGEMLSDKEKIEAIKARARILGRPLTGPEQKNAVESALKLKNSQKKVEALSGFSPQESKEEKDTEFQKLCKEFQEDFRNKKARYSIETKIPKGKDFHGYLEKGYKESYVTFVDGEEKREVLFTSAIKGRDGDWLKSGDAMIFLDPLPEMQYINGEKMQGVILKYNIDASNLSDIGRDIYAEIKLYIREDLATKIFEQIKADPKNFWKIVESVEPELLSLVPKRETDLSETSGKYAKKRPLGLVVYDKDKFKEQFTRSGKRDRAESEYFRKDARNFEVLSWDKEVKK